MQERKANNSTERIPVGIAPPRYLIMDGRAFTDVDSAVLLETGDTLKEAKQRAKSFGRLSHFEVAIVDNKTDEVLWELYR